MCSSASSDRSIKVCGTILWECKRTKNWSDGWLPKLREDQRAAKAEIAVIISQALPKDVETFGFIDGVWIADPKVALPVALSLRQTLIEVASARQASRRPADQNGNGLRLSHRAALSSACSSDCRSILIHERRSGPREKGHYPPMGQARRTDRPGHATPPSACTATSRVSPEKLCRRSKGWNSRGCWTSSRRNRRLILRSDADDRYRNLHPCARRAVLRSGARCGRSRRISRILLRTRR